MAFRKLFIGVACLVAVPCLNTIGHTQDLANWIRPYNFYTPSLDAGQYALQAGVILDGQKSTTDNAMFQESYRSETTSDKYSFSTRFLYAFTDRLAMVSDVNFIPGQGEQKTSSTQTVVYGQSDSEYDLKPSYNVSLTMTYKTTPVFELFGTASYSRSQRELRPVAIDSDYKNTSESYRLFFGFNTAR